MSNCKFLIAILIFVLVTWMPCLLFALELPLFVNWTSANSFYYAPDQEDKELNWNEFYRLELGIDSLSYQNISTDLLIRSKANFLSTYLELHEAKLIYTAGKIHFGGIITDNGYTRSNQLHPSGIVNSAMDDYLFMPSRLNGIFLEYSSPIILQAEIGGNFHNLATGKFSATFPFMNNSGTLALIQEVRTFDSQWHKPVLISAMQLNYDSPGLAASATTAMAMYPEFESRPSDIVPFAHLEARKDIDKGISIYLQAWYRELSPEISIHKSLDVAVSKQLSEFMLGAGSKYDHIHHDPQYTPYAVLQWLPEKGKQLGIYYRAIIGDSGSLLHQAGLQAELNFGF